MTPTTKPPLDTIDVSVITTCYGRNRHLYNLLSSLANGSRRPSEVIIVNDDADAERLAQYPLNIVQVATSKDHSADIDSQENISKSTETPSQKTGFDIGYNRNLGAKKASYDLLIFLDVDCIVSTTFIEQLTYKLRDNPTVLLMGQPLYLTRPLTDEESLRLQQACLSNVELNDLAVVNPYRHNLVHQADESEARGSSEVATISERTQDYGAFWSLCFAISKTQFATIGGFDTDYVGYGAEDTDFAFMARTLDIDFYLTSDVIYHQQHSVYRPPLNHFSSIVLNANRFYDKWQHWPMGGWLKSFSEMKIIDWESQQQCPIIVIRQPSQAEIDNAHYIDAPYV